jgi:hypothetical protein
MALSVSQIANGNSTTSSATLVVTLTTSVAVNDAIVVSVSARPAGTSGAISISSVTDSKSNKYHLIASVRSQGTGVGGASVAMFYAVATTAMTSSDTITINFSPNTPDKAVLVHKITAGANNVATVKFSATTAGGGSLTSLARGMGGTLATNDLAFGLIAIRNNGTITGDTDTTRGTWAAIVVEKADTGTASTSSQIGIQTKVVTSGGTQTMDTTFPLSTVAAIGSTYTEKAIVTATADASLGGLSASATAILIELTRFYLDQSTLDDIYVGLGGPSPAFVLDTSTLDGNGVLDGTNFTTPATAAASLGSTTAAATGTVTSVVTATADAPLGELIAEVSDITITVDGDAAADLGGLTAASQGVVSKVAEASAGLGEATSAATGVITVVATAAGLLGGLVASADGAVSADAVGDAPLGGLDATAIGTVTPQPTPTQTQTGGGPYRQRRPKPKPVEQPVEVVPEVVVNPNTVLAYCTPIVASVVATAEGAVTFVAEDDDLQVLLML